MATTMPTIGTTTKATSIHSTPIACMLLLADVIFTFVVLTLISTRWQSIHITSTTSSTTSSHMSTLDEYMIPTITSKMLPFLITEASIRIRDIDTIDNITQSIHPPTTASAEMSTSAISSTEASSCFLYHICLGPELHDGLMRYDASSSDHNDIQLVLHHRVQKWHWKRMHTHQWSLRDSFVKSLFLQTGVQVCQYECIQAT